MLRANISLYVTVCNPRTMSFIFQRMLRWDFVHMFISTFIFYVTNVNICISRHVSVNVLIHLWLLLQMIQLHESTKWTNLS
jgi:hypothetical protein